MYCNIGILYLQNQWRIYGGDPGGLDPPPGSEFRLCMVFLSKFENPKNINIQYVKLGTPQKESQNPPLFIIHIKYVHTYFYHLIFNRDSNTY